MYQLRRAIPGLTEDEALWQRDWEWVNSNIERIVRDRGETRRFELQALVSSVAYGFGGKEASEGWQQLYESTMTDDDREAIEKSEHQDAQRNLKQERLARFGMLDEQKAIAARQAEVEAIRAAAREREAQETKAEDVAKKPSTAFFSSG